MTTDTASRPSIASAPTTDSLGHADRQIKANRTPLTPLTPLTPRVSRAPR